MLHRITQGLILLAALACAGIATAQTTAPATEVATFAGGCFWCMEEAFEKVSGVTTAVSGYMGGTVANPTYQQVSGGRTGHAEVVQVTYDPAKVSYEKLVEWFWVNIDPVDASGQFCDKGSQYRSAIFYHTEEQKRIAQSSKDKLQASGKLKKPIVTEIAAAGPFYQAEDYHQDYYKKNPVRYQYYKFGCGRAARLEQLWGKPSPPPTQ
ncbi:MAG TPA: peptide-methionine (S)-S-oxide reductase MsrA [Hyphomicrobiaceae bacterium]|nr:peptide-methionine (S)-S-oxide reductase MsrA [Hyphomicrobiaceae bacterium]